MNKLSIRNRMLVGLTLFSMFFGAGNLIFPPSPWCQAGTKTPLGHAGIFHHSHRVPHPGCNCGFPCRQSG